MNILLGVTGSVAACLTPKLVKALQALGEVRVIFTDKGWEMSYGGDRLANHDWVAANFRGYWDADEWPKGWRKGDPVLHIDLKNWADLLVVAPCTANTLAKMANGLSDNLLTNVVRAWPSTKPLCLALAMNTDMWNKRATNRHLATLKEDYWPNNLWLADPQKKVLACGDYGPGAMADITAIVDLILYRSRVHEFYYRTVPNPILTPRLWMQEGNLFDAVVTKYRDRFVQRQDGADKVFGAVCLPNRDGTPGGICSPREKGQMFNVFDAVEITSIEGRIIYVNDTRQKATLNAPLLIRMGQKYPEATAILHLHEQLPGVPTMSFLKPGSAADNEREIPGPVFNIYGHGFIACLDANLNIWSVTT